jgi:hypothetical protein
MLTSTTRATTTGDGISLDVALMLKRTIPTAGLAVLPRTGHTANLEEPHRFSEVVDRFPDFAGRGAWPARAPRSMSASATGVSPS